MDLTPDISASLAQVNQAMKQRALAVLAHAGLEAADALNAVGGAFWADILFVTGRSRDSLDSEQLEALGKASVALGYGATAHALLSLDAKNLDAAKDLSPIKTDFVLEAYARALSSDIIVFLETETAAALQQHRQDKANRPVEKGAGESSPSFVREIVVNDFFASLEETTDKQDKKRQAWKELQAARLQPAMR